MLQKQFREVEYVDYIRDCPVTLRLREPEPKDVLLRLRGIANLCSVCFCFGGDGQVVYQLLHSVLSLTGFAPPR